MQIIVCKLNMFSLNQVVQVFDTDENKIIYTEAVNGEKLIPLICALAKKLEINEVRLDGIYDYTINIAEEIKTTFSLNYGNNNINVEVI